MSSTSSNTSLSLKFVIVGGGIAGECRHFVGTCVVLNHISAGLATAFTLKRAGHSVVVLEKRNDKTMVRLFLSKIYTAYNTTIQSFGRVGGGIR